MHYLFYCGYVIAGSSPSFQFWVEGRWSQTRKGRCSGMHRVFYCIASIGFALHGVSAYYLDSSHASRHPQSTSNSSILVKPTLSARSTNSSRVLARPTLTTPIANTTSYTFSVNTNDPATCTAMTCNVPVRIPVSDVLPALTIPHRSNNSLETELAKECVLWDPTCKGNKTAAAINFFKKGGTKDFLGDVESACWVSTAKTCVAQAVQTQYPKIKDWMRSEQCQSDMMEYDPPEQKKFDVDSTCCGLCFLNAGNVDVYYWPEPDVSVDESCLKTIGSTILPIDYGATTDTSRSSTYWGCWSSWPQNNGGGWDHMATAILTSAMGITYREYLYDPWSSPGYCPDSQTYITPSPATPVPSSTSYPSLYAHATALRVRDSGHWRNGTNGSHVSTVVSGSFTL